MLFAAVHESASGTQRHSRRCNIPGRYWSNNGQRWISARARQFSDGSLSLVSAAWDATGCKRLGSVYQLHCHPTASSPRTVLTTPL